MVTIKYDDLSLAFHFVSSGAPMEHRAFVSLETGKVYWASEVNPVDEEELPDDLDTSDRYLEIPHKNDLNLGRQLALRFVEERLPAQHNRVADIFHRRGAYRRFKELLASENCLEQWYVFETEATEQALREWCQRTIFTWANPLPANLRMEADADDRNGARLIRNGRSQHRHH